MTSTPTKGCSVYCPHGLRITSITQLHNPRRASSSPARSPALSETSLSVCYEFGNWNPGHAVQTWAGEPHPFRCVSLTHSHVHHFWCSQDTRVVGFPICLTLRLVVMATVDNSLSSSPQKTCPSLRFDWVLFEYPFRRFIHMGKGSKTPPVLQNVLVHVVCNDKPPPERSTRSQILRSADSMLQHTHRNSFTAGDLYHITNIIKLSSPISSNYH